MNTIDVRTRQPRNLVSSGDSLVSGALTLTNVGHSATLPDTSTTRTHTLTAGCRLFSLRLDTTALVAVGVGVSAVSTASLEGQK